MRAFDALPEGDGHVVIAGFGRVGQIVARVLSAKRIPFTALDVNAEQVDFVRKFGAEIYYGDASRPEILEAAKTGKARALVLAIDNVDVSIRTAQLVRQNYPHVPIYARSRHRQHTHRLMDAGVQVIRRETFLSSLDLTREVLRGLGFTERDVRFAVETFKEQDRRRLYEDYKHYTDIEKLQNRAKTYAQELEELFEKDAAEQAKLAREAEENGGGEDKHRRQADAGVVSPGSHHAKEHRPEEAEVQELRRQGYPEKGRQGRSLPAVRGNRHQAELNGLLRTPPHGRRRRCREQNPLAADPVAGCSRSSALPWRPTCPAKSGTLRSVSLRAAPD